MKNIKKYRNFLESKKNKFPNIKKEVFNDFIIYVGKDAKSNDHLTFNVAENDDLWFHTKGEPGSHVVIRVKDRLPTDEVIKYAASLAKKNSKAKNKNIAEVVYCKVKFVKKAKNMNPGQVKVDYTNSYTIKINN